MILPSRRIDQSVGGAKDVAAASRLFNELTREQLREQAPKAMVVLPMGATEQHGPHLPVGTDAFAVERVAREAASEASGQVPILVAPTLFYGSSHHHLPFGGTMSIQTETYYRVVRDLVESLITCGFGRVFVLNGHGGNHELIQIVVRDLALQFQVSLAAASYWDIAMDALRSHEELQTFRIPGHAGTFETSLIMALHPTTVQEPRPHRDSDPTTMPSSNIRHEYHGFLPNIDGYTDSPANASADLGLDYLSRVVTAVSEAFVSFYEETEKLGVLPD
jgi:creatinine amidohydrolase